VCAYSEAGAPVSVIRTAILAEFPRLRALWPVLESKPEHLAEIGKAVMRHESRITPEDVSHGFDRVIQESPTTSWPPGPHEVLGCILDERRRRVRDDSPVPRVTRTTGLSFAEWWHSLAEDERERHEALHRIMAAGKFATPEARAPVGVEVDSW